MRTLGEQKKIRFYKKFIGTSRPVLVEGRRDEKGLLKGFTDNYIPVFLSGDEQMMNTILNAELVEIRGSDILAKPTRKNYEG
jgi:threonylcarbamoyladenosine tRNA methylthiotransferase MtaB